MLPPASESRGWGELDLTSAAPHAGRHWTNDGALRETRALKDRIEGESRTVPIPPQLVVILREHLGQLPDGPEGRLFYGVRSASLPSTTYVQAWWRARDATLSPREQRSPLARRPYDLRHALRLDLAERRCGRPTGRRMGRHGLDVLLKIYAKTIDGQEAIGRQRIEDALAHGLDDHDQWTPATSST